MTSSGYSLHLHDDSAIFIYYWINIHRLIRFHQIILHNQVIKKLKRKEKHKSKSVKQLAEETIFRKNWKTKWIIIK